MNNKVKFTVNNTEQLEKAKNLLSLFPEEISIQINYINILNSLLENKPQCIINVIEEKPVVIILPNNALSITTFDDHILIIYNQFTFKILLKIPVKLVNYRFIECKDLEQFRI